MGEPSKEATWILVDVSRSMASDIADVKGAVLDMLSTKIFHHKQDVVGILLLGTEKSENALNAEMGDGQYEHITTLRNMAKVDFDALRTVHDELEADSGAADLVDGIALGLHLLLGFVRKLKFAKRLLIITSAAAPCDPDDDNLGELAQKMKAEDVALTVYGAGFDEGGGDSDAQKLLDKLRAQLDDPRLFEQRPLADGVRNAAALHGKPVRATKAFAGPLQLVGGRSLPVECWRRVSKATSIGFKKVSKSGVDSADAPGNPAETVSYEKRHFVASAPDDDVTPESIVKAMRFGRDLIPIQKADEEMMGNGVEEKTFALIGFVPQETLPRHFLLGTAETVIGAAGGAHAAVQALAAELDMQEKVGIARYASRKSANPRLVCLWPSPELDCLYLCDVPFAEERRVIEWLPAPAEPDAAQKSAAAALVDALALMPADDGDGADEPLRPEDVRHPQQQYTYQCIKHRAMQHLRGDGTADIGLPAPDWRILRSFKRDEALWQRAAPQLAAFKEACPLAAAAAGTKRKGAFQADETEANKRAAGGDGGGGGTSGGGGVGVGGGGGAFDLASTSVTKVDSAKPIETFWAMLKDQTEDRVTDALEQMAHVVKDLFAAASSADDASATKAYACVRELRRASVQEEEVGYYNDLLASLKTAWGGGRVAFWRALLADAELKAGKITADETEDSEVTAAQAAEFWRDVDGGAAAAAVPAATQPGATQDEDEYDDLE